MNNSIPVQVGRILPITFVSARGLAALLLLACLGGGLNPSLRADELPPLEIKAVALVSGDGLFVSDVVTSPQPLPAVRLADAPAFGKNLSYTRAQLVELLAAAVPALGTNFTGAATVKVSRRTRPLGEAALLELLTTTLQNNYIKDRGQLELRLAQPWTALVLPDEPLLLDVQELPSLGVTPRFIVRFTLRTSHETLGTWQAGIQASVWREVWVSSGQIARGESVNLQQLSRERRDVLALRDNVADLTGAVDALEFAEPVPAGVPVLARMVKPRTVIHRGQRVDALVQDGVMSLKTKVEALEDGAPGQYVRARNLQSRRDMSGKVLDDRTILISL
jgi:flagellar basal body P-ring formation protein FlgA